MPMLPFQEYQEEDFLPLSGIQHFAFCPRQWGLIHLEQQWQENSLTAQGRAMHEHVHDVFQGYRRKAKSYSCGIAVHSRRLGIYGVCDLVEFEEGEPIPVEYKRGKPKTHEADVLQLVLQALCLEEMLCCKIDIGFLYYGEIRRRVQMALTTDLREEATKMVLEMHRLYQKRYTPKAKKQKHCQSCSLKDLCLPGLEKAVSAQHYIQKTLAEVPDEEVAEYTVYHQ